MSIADKLAYLAGTKAAIRQAIEAQGVIVGDELPFRQYAEKIGDIEGGGGGVVSARYWRILVLAHTSGSFVGLQEMKFNDAFPSGVGVIFSTQHDSGDFAALNAFSDNGKHWFSVSGKTDGAFIGWHFDTPTSVTKISIMAGDSASRAGYAPTEFRVESSGDGEGWTTRAHMTAADWQPNQVREFTL